MFSIIAGIPSFTNPVTSRACSRSLICFIGIINFQEIKLLGLVNLSPHNNIIFIWFTTDMRLNSLIELTG
jgi:hypothetical protein